MLTASTSGSELHKHWTDNFITVPAHPQKCRQSTTVSCEWIWVHVKYRFPIGIQWRSKIHLRDEVCISKTKGSRCRGKVSESERNTEPIYWKGRGFASARALHPSLRLVPDFGERLGGGRKSERKSIGQTKSIFKLKSNYQHGLYLYESKVLAGI
jgi:hypothetical protein